MLINETMEHALIRQGNQLLTFFMILHGFLQLYQYYKQSDYLTHVSLKMITNNINIKKIINIYKY